MAVCVCVLWGSSSGSQTQKDSSSKESAHNSSGCSLVWPAALCLSLHSLEMVLHESFPQGLALKLAENWPLLLPLPVNHSSKLPLSYFIFFYLFPFTFLSVIISPSLFFCLSDSWHLFLFLPISLSGCWPLLTLPVSLTSSQETRKLLIGSPPHTSFCVC